jgi:hypothetical protein
MMDELFAKYSAIARSVRPKTVVKPSKKTSFTMGDVKAVEKLIGSRVIVYQNRLCDRSKQQINSSFKADLELVKQARSKK